MANLVRVGMPIQGRTRRFVRLPRGKYMYSCPKCLGLVAHDQAFCVCNEDLRIVSDLYAKEARE